MGLVPTETGHFYGLSAAQNAAIWGAQYNDACAFVTAPGADPTVTPGTYEQCRLFSSGLMTRGLAAASTYYLNVIDTFSDERMRARLFITPFTANGTLRTELAGLGVVWPEATYNYSADAADAFVAGNSLVVTDAAEGQPPHPLAEYTGDIPVEDAWAVNGSTRYSMPSRLASETMTWLTTADALYITPGFMHITVIYYTAGEHGEHGEGPGKG